MKATENGNFIGIIRVCNCGACSIRFSVVRGVCAALYNFSPKNRIRRINHAVLDHAVDVRRVRDVVDRDSISGSTRSAKYPLSILPMCAPVSPPKSLAAFAVAHCRICMFVSPACFIS